MVCNRQIAGSSLLSELHVTTLDKLFACIYLRHEAVVLEVRTDVSWNQNSRDTIRDLDPAIGSRTEEYEMNSSSRFTLGMGTLALLVL